MKYFNSIMLNLLKGLLAIPAAIIFFLTIILIGASNLVKIIYNDSEVPLRFTIEKIEDEVEVKLDEAVVVEEPVKEVIKPKQARKPRVKKVVEELAVSEQK